MNCSICSIAQKHVAVKIVYEDAVSVAYLSLDPAAVGHTLIVPRQHAEILEELPDSIVTHLFYVASYAASAVYEGLASHGTNIICNNGSEAGEKNHIALHVVPRKDNDALSFVWEPKQLSPADFDDTVKKIKDKTDLIGEKKETKKATATIITPSSPQCAVSSTSENTAIEASEKEVIAKGEEENYMIKHLYKIP